MTPRLYRHIFFDLDGTLTRSRSFIEDAMRDALVALMASGCDVIVVSGARESQIRKQVLEYATFHLGQNGNHAVEVKNNTELWHDLLTEAQKTEIFAHIRTIPRPWKVKDENDLIEDRGAQISYSLVGHHEDLAVKEAFDTGGKKRMALLEAYPLISEKVAVKIGGTSCFDYFAKGRDKGYNVARLIKNQGWEKEECVYVGDALFPGGNDDAVIGVIDIQPVKDPGETLEFIAKVLG